MHTETFLSAFLHVFLHLAAYQSTSITQITVLVQWTWSHLGGRTQKYHAFKQPLSYKVLGFSFQNLILHKLS